MCAHPSLTDTTHFRNNGICGRDNKAKVDELLNRMPLLLQTVAEIVKEAGAVTANAADVAEHKDEGDQEAEDDEEEEEEEEGEEEKREQDEEEEADDDDEDDADAEDEHQDTGKRQKNA
jgi:hypothetical protein